MTTPRGTSSTSPVVLLVGGTGQTGMRIAERLRSVSPDTVIRILSRSASRESLQARLGPEVEVVTGDAADPVAVERAMAGVTHVFYVVGPTMSASLLFSTTATESPYVTGLERVLAAGRSTGLLEFVALLSAEGCDRPWAPLSAVTNAVVGASQLMHLRQERLLHAETKRREGFRFLVVRPPSLGPADADPEPVTLDLVEGPRGRSRPATRSVSRSAVAEVMVQSMRTGLPATPATVTLTADEQADRSSTIDWAGALEGLGKDPLSLPTPDQDSQYAQSRLVVLGGTVLTLAIGLAMVVLGAIALL